MASRVPATGPQCRLAGLLIVAASLSLPLAPARAADRWEQAASGSVATLPLPSPAHAITGGALSCAKQRWSLRLWIDRPPQVSPLSDRATLAIGQARFPVAIEQDRISATIRLSPEILDLLKSGSRLTITVEDDVDPPPSATFALRGSRAVLEAIAPLCSQVDMSAYVAVTLSEADPAVEIARPLLAAEARLFRAATGRQPAYAATTLSLDGDRRLMFASLCGSTSYYGRSGCTLAGFAAASPDSEWQPVYNSEGVRLHTDPRVSNGGWPNLVTLPVTDGVEPEHWMWDGTEYRNAAAVAEIEDDVPPPQ